MVNTCLVVDKCLCDAVGGGGWIVLKIVGRGLDQA